MIALFHFYRTCAHPAHGLRACTVPCPWRLRNDPLITNGIFVFELQPFIPTAYGCLVADTQRGPDTTEAE